MAWRPVWVSSAPPVSAPSVSPPGSAAGAAPSFEWTPNFESLSINDQIVEIHDHITRLIALVATMRAEQAARDERTQDQSHARGITDMSQPR